MKMGGDFVIFGVKLGLRQTEALINIASYLFIITVMSFIIH